MKECILCGNTTKKELEVQTLYSDGSGNDGEEKVYICKEDKGCNK